ncbi:MAG: SPFH domain-containing protein, partial [Planctomycetota bacterium]
MNVTLLAADNGLLLTVAIGAVACLAGFMGLVWVIKQFLFICRPDEVLVFSGRDRKLVGGQSVGYRVIFGGRAFRWPLLEEVKRMDLSVIEVTVSTQNAFCKGGIRLNVDAIANVKVTGDPRLVGNAIERF